MHEITCLTIEELRSWLKENYHTSQSLWLIFPKKSSGIGSITVSDIVDELLCWGWIDSLPGKVDDVYTKVRISPRNPKSNWSGVNKRKVERLKKEGRIQPHGYEVIERAKKNGTWNALDDVERLVIPRDLMQSLISTSTLDAWNSLAPSKRRGILEQLLNSKKSETRTKKIYQIIDMLQ